MILGPTDIPFLGKLTDDVCLSGGAAGADVTWGNNAYKAGHQVVHWSFEGHKSHDLENTFVLSDEELKESDDYLREANLTLKRRLNFKKRYIMLLQRNWYQVKYADSMYAIGSLNEKAVIYDPKEGRDQKYHITNDRKDRMGVNGGTGWATQLYLDLYRRKLGKIKFSMYFYDQYTNIQYSYSPTSGCWFTLKNKGMPPPSGIYAAIGSRELNNDGKKFIESLF